MRTVTRLKSISTYFNETMTTRNYNFTPGAAGNANKKLNQGMVLLMFLLITGLANVKAEEAPDLTKPQIIVPEKITGVTTVTAEDLFTILTSDARSLLIDARIKNDRDYGYIENSISLPDIKTNCDTLSNINPDKDQHMLFYCNGIRCGRSMISIKVARSCGYHNLSWFKGGFSEWKEKGYQYIKNQ